MTKNKELQFNDAYGENFNPFIGKKIKSIQYTSGHVSLRFTDKTTGYICFGYTSKPKDRVQYTDIRKLINNKKIFLVGGMFVNWDGIEAKS